MTTAAGGLKQRSLHDFFAKSVRTPDSISKRLELVDETDSDIEAAVANLDNNDDEMNVTYDDADDDAQTDFTLPKRISFSPSQCSEPDGEPSCDPDVASSQKQHPWSDDFAPPSFSQMYSQQSFCDFSTPQDQPVVHMSHPRSPSPIKKRPRTLPTFQGLPFLDPPSTSTAVTPTAGGQVDHETNSEACSLAVESPRGPSPPFAPTLAFMTTPFADINQNPFAPVTSTERKRKKKHSAPPLWLGAATASKYLHDFVEREVLGSGSFSKVFKVTKRFDGWTYAIKKSKRRFRSASDKQRALREVHALVALSDSRHIVRYYDAWIENELLYIQLEFMHGCSLATFLGDATHVSEATVRKVLKHLATALRDMHAMKVVHMDVKVDNILRHPTSGVFKLGDLGTVVPMDGSMEIMEGDNRYLSRELLEGNRSHLCQGDIFALGATMYELVNTARRPTHDDATSECVPRFAARASRARATTGRRFEMAS
ncbi:WEE/WEE1 protein kinase, variant [Aphanomyces invadans]|uniref:WEE/WEE1 protein kinase, variant n=1 Tax=Aphanomyces invadans TaxID=157072 RepID=A0A024TKB3_9STRA|nr:WEE/WEE1 protein kinase, variant [Aphanomyces invadans]ETV94468.1 WEE/WEE1 protein kinase, variant [Aphanomyces invadans]|eukprot:XP_008876783.1 WEE/WEE1 protein kinase, variant [Aphanomyces invadans]